MKDQIIQALFNSPLRKLMNNTVLISFKNRFNGSEQSRPIYCLREKDTITCFTDFDTDWWRNLAVNSDVQVRIKDQDWMGTAHIITSDDDQDMMVYQLTAVDPEITYEEAVQQSHYVVMVQVNLAS